MIGRLRNARGRIVRLVAEGRSPKPSATRPIRTERNRRSRNRRAHTWSRSRCNHNRGLASGREWPGVPKVRTCRCPLRKPSAYVPLVKLSNVARRTQGQGHTPQRVPAAAGCLDLGFSVSANCCPRVHASGKSVACVRPLREGATAAAGRAPNGACLPAQSDPQVAFARSFNRRHHRCQRAPATRYRDGTDACAISFAKSVTIAANFAKVEQLHLGFVPGAR